MNILQKENILIFTAFQSEEYEGLGISNNINEIYLIFGGSGIVTRVSLLLDKLIDTKQKR